MRQSMARKRKPTNRETTLAAHETSAVRPTPERQRRGVWVAPKQVRKDDHAVIDITADIIGLLHHREMISDGQEQAARHWQRLRAAYKAELPDVAGFKSCLNGDVPGYDDGDGNPDVIKAYRDMEKALGHRGRRVMLWVCELNNRPASMSELRWALDVVEGY